MRGPSVFAGYYKAQVGKQGQACAHLADGAHERTSATRSPCRGLRDRPGAVGLTSI